MLSFCKDDAEKSNKSVYFSPKGVKCDLCAFLNFSSIRTKCVAKLGLCGNITWTFSLEKIGQIVTVVLDCEPKNSSIANRKEWAVEADVVVRLVNQTAKEKSVTLSSPKTEFHRRKEDGHWSHSFSQVLTENSGFVKDDTVVFHLQIGITDVKGLYAGNFIDFSVPRANESDVVLVANNTKFHVSKKILSIQSPVFDAMFNGRFVETDSKKVSIQDVDVVGFHLLLQYIYMAPLFICEENVAQMLELADRFLVKRLIRECENFLIDSQMDQKQVIKLASTFNLQRLLCKKISEKKNFNDLVLSFPSDLKLPPVVDMYLSVRMAEERLLSEPS